MQNEEVEAFSAYFNGLRHRFITGGAILDIEFEFNTKDLALRRLQSIYSYRNGRKVILEGNVVLTCKGMNYKYKIALVDFSSCLGTEEETVSFIRDLIRSYDTEEYIPST